MTDLKQSTDAMRSAYAANGYAVVRDAAPRDVVRRFLGVIHGTMVRHPEGLQRFVLDEPRVNVQRGYEFYGYRLPSVMAFHWALTSRVAEIADRPLLPSFVFFRVYMKGDRCLVHSDRPSCEHSLSMSLGYADDTVWPLEIGRKTYAYEDLADRAKEDDFGDDAHEAVALEPGDGLFYRGVNQRHARITPNPNRWSAHLFFFWVDAEGPFRDHAFDRMAFPDAVDFPPL